MNIPAELRAWLVQQHPGAPEGDSAGRGADALQERLLSLTRALRPRRAEVVGALVVHDPSGHAFAAAYDGRILLRGTRLPAALDADAVDGVPGWSSVTAEPADITFTRGSDVLRVALEHAFETRA
jgi:hypothetical protein